MRYPLIFAMSWALILGACAQPGPQGTTAPGLTQPPSLESSEYAAPAVTTVAPAPAPAITSTGGGGRFHVGNNPYAAIGPSGTAGTGTIEGELVVIEEDEELVQEKRRLDTAACYEYARAQTRHDQRIIDDQSAAFDDSTFEPSLKRAQQQGEQFGLRKREKRLIQDCMQTKGYESL